MARYDTEVLLKTALSTVQSLMNSEITALNTEKADFEVASVNASAYYFGSLPKVWNHNPMIVYGIDSQPTLEAVQDDNAVKPVILYFEVVLVDGGSKEDENIIYKLLRYSRVLEDIFQKNSGKIMQGYGTLKVTGLAPTSLFSADGKLVRSAGVTVTARITAR
jgi:hypothetical protein